MPHIGCVSCQRKSQRHGKQQALLLLWSGPCNSALVAPVLVDDSLNPKSGAASSQSAAATAYGPLQSWASCPVDFWAATPDPKCLPPRPRNLLPPTRTLTACEVELLDAASFTERGAASTAVQHASVVGFNGLPAGPSSESHPSSPFLRSPFANWPFGTEQGPRDQDGGTEQEVRSVLSAAHNIVDACDCSLHVQLNANSVEEVQPYGSSSGDLQKQQQEVPTASGPQLLLGRSGSPTHGAAPMLLDSVPVDGGAVNGPADTTQPASSLRVTSTEARDEEMGTASPPVSSGSGAVSHGLLSSAPELLHSQVDCRSAATGLAALPHQAPVSAAAAVSQMPTTTPPQQPALKQELLSWSLPGVHLQEVATVVAPASASSSPAVTWSTVGGKRRLAAAVTTDTTPSSVDTTPCSASAAEAAAAASVDATMQQVCSPPLQDAPESVSSGDPAQQVGLHSSSTESRCDPRGRLAPSNALNKEEAGSPVPEGPAAPLPQQEQDAEAEHQRLRVSPFQLAALSVLDLPSQVSVSLPSELAVLSSVPSSSLISRASLVSVSSATIEGQLWRSWLLPAASSMLSEDGSVLAAAAATAAQGATGGPGGAGAQGQAKQQLLLVRLGSGGGSSGSGELPLRLSISCSHCEVAAEVDDLVARAVTEALFA